MLFKAYMLCIPMAIGERYTYLLQARPVTILKNLYKMISYMMIYGRQNVWLGQ